MSNALKSIKPTRKVFHARGTAMRAMSCPATSSMTTNCGSLLSGGAGDAGGGGDADQVTRTASAMAAGVRRDGGSA